MLWQSLLSSVEAGDDLATTGKPDLKQRTGFFGQCRFIDIRHAERFLNSRWQERFNAWPGWQHTSLRAANPQSIKSTAYSFQRAQYLDAVMGGFRLENRRSQTVPPETEGGFIGLMRQHPCERGKRVEARIKTLELLIFNRIQTGSARPTPERQALTNYLCPIIKILDALARPAGSDRTQDGSHPGRGV